MIPHCLRIKCNHWVGLRVLFALRSVYALLTLLECIMHYEHNAYSEHRVGRISKRNLICKWGGLHALVGSGVFQPRSCFLVYGLCSLFAVRSTRRQSCIMNGKSICMQRKVAATRKIASHVMFGPFHLRASNSITAFVRLHGINSHNSVRTQSIGVHNCLLTTSFTMGVVGVRVVVRDFRFGRIVNAPNQPPSARFRHTNRATTIIRRGMGFGIYLLFYQIVSAFMWMMPTTAKTTARTTKRQI